MKKTIIAVLALITVATNAYALSVEAEQNLKQVFYNAWNDYCLNNPIGNYDIDELGLSWYRTEPEYYQPDTDQMDLDRMFDQSIASIFFSEGLKKDIFAEDSFARAAGDYLEKMYIEIRDHYIELTEKELEKRSLLKPSYVKKLVALFNSVTAI